MTGTRNIGSTDGVIRLISKGALFGGLFLRGTVYERCRRRDERGRRPACGRALLFFPRRTDDEWTTTGPATRHPVYAEPSASGIYKSASD
ncbi:hypothetical protein MTO96_022213 [Rhipicephalus appendiculatus]